MSKEQRSQNEYRDTIRNSYGAKLITFIEQNIHITRLKQSTTYKDSMEYELLWYISLGIDVKN